MSDSTFFATYKQFYPQLLQVLPMDDAVFLGKLFHNNLLPGDTKMMISAKQTQAQKAAYFLDHVITPAFHVDEASNTLLNKLLKLMTESEYDTTRLLAANITASMYQ